MDFYFVAPPPPVTAHAPHVPEAIPVGNSYQVSQHLISCFWSVRDQWLEEGWSSQSESSYASLSAQVQPPAYVPYSTMVPVVMISW